MGMDIIDVGIDINSMYNFNIHTNSLHFELDYWRLSYIFACVEEHMTR